MKQSLIFLLFAILCTILNLAHSASILDESPIYVTPSTESSKTDERVLHELNSGLRMTVEELTLPKKAATLLMDVEGDEIILYGSLSPLKDAYKFTAKQAYLSLPPVNNQLPLAGYNEYFTVKQLPIECLRAPCNNIQVNQLNNGEGKSHTVSMLDFKNLDVPSSLFTDWIKGIVMNGSAIAQGEISQAGEVITFEVHDVFIKVPFARMCSDEEHTTCAQGQVAAYKLTPQLCVVPSDTKCVPVHPCPLIRPACPTGYKLFGFINDSGCLKSYCFPTFLGLSTD